MRHGIPRRIDRLLGVSLNDADDLPQRGKMRQDVRIHGRRLALRLAGDGSQHHGQRHHVAHQAVVGRDLAGVRVLQELDQHVETIAHGTQGELDGVCLMVVVGGGVALARDGGVVGRIRNSGCRGLFADDALHSDAFGLRCGEVPVGWIHGKQHGGGGLIIWNVDLIQIHRQLLLQRRCDFLWFVGIRAAAVAIPIHLQLAKHELVQREMIPQLLGGLQVLRGGFILLRNTVPSHDGVLRKHRLVQSNLQRRGLADFRRDVIRILNLEQGRSVAVVLGCNRGTSSRLPVFRHHSKQETNDGRVRCQRGSSRSDARELICHVNNRERMHRDHGGSPAACAWCIHFHVA
mmetsp:Transcript_18457/g.51301  ORF Transcript_18457/g.51301 Transcript_18457/m.51301 type:complete len:347 (-) Transcript_18457:247-1287(-)